MVRTTPLVSLLLAGLLLPSCDLFGQDEPRWDTGIPESEAFDAGAGAWGPDGERIVFTHTLDSANANPGAYDQLWTAHLQTGERRMVAPGRVLYPDWSPDGDWFVFHSKTDPEYLYKITADGDSLVRLTGPGSPNPKLEYTTNAEWSPSGDHILFSIIAGNPRGVTLMRLDGANARIIDDYSYSGAWLPDEKHIAFVDFDTTQAYDRSSQIYLMDTSGTDKRKLTGLPHTNYLSSPAISPDGRQIAFVYDGRDSDSRRDASSEVYLMSVDGTNIRQVTKGKGLIRKPTWHPSGEKILFSRFYPRPVGAYSHLFLLDVETLEVEPVFPKK